MADYYYLISSLPTLWFDEKHDKIDFDSIMQTIRENLSTDDRKLFNYLLYPNDNKNLIRSLSLKYKKHEIFHQFYQPAAVPEDVMSDFNQHSDQLPSYMQTFIEDNHDKLQDMKVSEWEKLLLKYFYQEVLSTGDEFLTKYYAFELNLKNIIATINSRTYGLQTHHELVGEEAINQQLIKSAAADFNLTNEYPFINELSEAINTKNPDLIEYQVQKILWHFIDELAGFSFFNTHRLLGYVVQLLMIRRIFNLKKEEGKERLNELTNKMMENFELPQLQK